MYFFYLFKIAEVPNSSNEIVDKAVQAAREAFDNGPWGQSTGIERSRYLNLIADKIDEV